ncbi:ABC transporter substrate-binding protein [Sinirhodobacter populi]|uniref:ABC transporter substrate-binding protein n=1 Tax=Paenirhodobacter populi TaxID=2306993 RepID=A0A443K6L4_9RHOB|nr:sugar ABC transporter substrate-binding protein [Sinirhodobacter populi]RWR28417.1 ABC transporter substrate-binding protein [Sinirhodobacter populi]
MTTFIKDFIAQETLNRRRLLLAGAAGLGAMTVPGAFRYDRALAAPGDPALAWSYRDRVDTYWNSIVYSGETFVQSLGKPKSDLVNLVNGGSSEKSLSDIKSFLAKSNGNCAIACDPNDSPNARPVVEAVRAANAYISTMWNKTDDLHPWDFGDNYVCHMTWSSVKPAEDAARILCKAMGGKGGIVHVGGIAANQPAIERLQGLKNALQDFPDIELLDAQPADWDTTKAAALMSAFLTRYGDQITGVHCGSDQMAYGVIEALRAEGIEGMPIVCCDGSPEAVNAVLDGRLLVTGFGNPYWSGGILLSLAYHAAIGTFKPSEEPNEHREFYGPAILITQDDAAEFKANFVDSIPTYDWNDFWNLSTGQIRYG